MWTGSSHWGGWGGGRKPETGIIYPRVRGRDFLGGEAVKVLNWIRTQVDFGLGVVMINSIGKEK